MIDKDVAHMVSHLLGTFEETNTSVTGITLNKLGTWDSSSNGSLANNPPP